jgi:hypothetical protein
MILAAVRIAKRSRCPGPQHHTRVMAVPAVN